MCKVRTCKYLREHVHTFPTLYRPVDTPASGRSFSPLPLCVFYFFIGYIVSISKESAAFLHNRSGGERPRKAWTDHEFRNNAGQRRAWLMNSHRFASSPSRQRRVRHLLVPWIGPNHRLSRLIFFRRHFSVRHRRKTRYILLVDSFYLELFYLAYLA